MYHKTIATPQYLDDWANGMKLEEVPPSQLKSYRKEVYGNRDYFSNGLEAIAQGQTAICLISGLFDESRSSENTGSNGSHKSNPNTMIPSETENFHVKSTPRCLTSPDWSHGYTLLGMAIKKLRHLAEYGTLLLKQLQSTKGGTSKARCSMDYVINLS